MKQQFEAKFQHMSQTLWWSLTSDWYWYHFWWVTNETGQLVCTALTISTAQAYGGLQLATDTDLFLMGEK